MLGLGLVPHERRDRRCAATRAARGGRRRRSGCGPRLRRRPRGRRRRPARAPRAPRGRRPRWRRSGCRRQRRGRGTPADGCRRRTAPRRASRRSPPTPGRGRRRRRTRRSRGTAVRRGGVATSVGRRVRCSATRTRSPTASPTSLATWPAYSLRTFGSGCSLTTSIARSARRARSSGVRAGRPLIDPIEPERQERHGVGDRRGQRVGILLGQLARIEAARQLGHRHLHLVLLLPRVEALGGTLAGGIGVERQHDPAGVALDQPHVVLGERRAARRHGPLDAGAVEADDVGVALADHDLVGGCDVGLRPVQPVERLRLGVDRRLRRVLVLRRVVGAGQDAAADRHRLAGVAEDREQDPRPEGVLQAVAAVAERQPGRLQQLAGDAAPPRQRIPVVGRPPELELAGDVTGEAARAQVVASGPGRRVVEQPLVVPARWPSPSPRRGACAGPAPATGRSTCS